MLQLTMALLEGVGWSALWILLLLIMFAHFPWLLVHDFPEDARKAAKLPETTAKQRRNGICFTVFSYIILVGALMAAGLFHYHGKFVSFGTVFLHLWIICILWNVVDLVVLDWLIFCTITPKSFILPGTENCKGYKDYKFHLVGFFKGCVYMSLFALVFAGIDFGILKIL